MIAWVLTYVLHSTALMLLAWAVARTPWGRGPRVREAIWKGALLGALVTATLQQATGGSASLAPAIRMSESRAAGLQSPAPGGRPWVAVAWSAASGLAAARLLSGWLRLRRMTGRRRVLARGPLRRELDAILRGAGVTRRVTLSCSRGLAVPRAIGAREICVPIRVLRDLTPAEQRALLAHETAHLLRRDGAWLFVAAVVQTVAWWQPLTRLAVARLRQSMELCCDDWAAARLPDRMALADCLVKVGEWGVAAPAGLPLAAFTSRGSTLRERVERLMDDDASGGADARTPWLAAIPVLVVFAFAPRVMLAETSIIPTLVVPALLRADPRVPTRAGSATRSAGAAHRARREGPFIGVARTSGLERSAAGVVARRARRGRCRRTRGVRAAGFTGRDYDGGPVGDAHVAAAHHQQRGAGHAGHSRAIAAGLLAGRPGPPHRLLARIAAPESPVRSPSPELSPA